MAETVRIGGIELALGGGLFRVARPLEEWDTDVPDPSLLVEGLRQGPRRADILTFAQRIPQSRPLFPFPHQWESVAALPISTHKRWLEEQITQEARNKLRRSAKSGVEVRPVPFDEELVRGLWELYNESPLRQGKRFTGYGMTPEEIREDHATFLDRSRYFAAFHAGNMIGFIKLVEAGRFTRTMGIMARISHRDKSPTNALLARAVEDCAERGSPFLVYGRFDYGGLGSDSLREFKKSNGFENVLVPRYHLPLTPRGRLYLALGMQRGLRRLVPAGAIPLLRGARAALAERALRHRPGERGS